MVCLVEMGMMDKPLVEIEEEENGGQTMGAFWAKVAVLVEEDT